MVAPAHTKVTFSGVFGSTTVPVEIWQFSLNFKPLAFADDAQRQGLADAIALKYATTFSSAHTSAATMTRVRVAQIGPDGLVSKGELGDYDQADKVAAVVGSGTGTQFPLQTAMCISLQTPRAGASGKGRFFVPAPAATVGADFRATAAIAIAQRDRAISLIDGINDAIFAAGVGDTGPNYCVVPSSKGYLSEVTSVRVGRVLDTQRRRRGDLLEDYQEAPLYA